MFYHGDGLPGDVRVSDVLGGDVKLENSIPLGRIPSLSAFPCPKREEQSVGVRCPGTAVLDASMRCEPCLAQSADGGSVAFLYP